MQYNRTVIYCSNYGPLSCEGNIVCRYSSPITGGGGGRGDKMGRASDLGPEIPVFDSRLCQRLAKSARSESPFGGDSALPCACGYQGMQGSGDLPLQIHP